ncbi:MAG: BamA/TamA family outer membrane protein, partial [Sediminibacterium sp.]|nr:BamA/TamA family outer membrane protein [Sediminibacterium sp.]
SYSSFPDKFFKIGNKTNYNESEKYTYNQFYFNAQISRKFVKNINFGVRVDFQRVFSIDYEPNGYLQQIYGDIKNGFVTAGLGVSASLDKRNNTYSPDKGYFAQIYIVDYNDFFKSDYTFTNINLDFRKFLKSSKSSVIALQLFSNINVGSIIPVRNLSGIGGTTISRGYYDSRFIDKNSAIIQAEFRQSLENVPISFFKNFGVVFFGSFGDVFSTPNQLSFKLLKTAIGTGLRYAINKSQRINLRIDVGYNVFDRTFAPLFQIGEAF